MPAQRTIFGIDESLPEDYGFCERCEVKTATRMVSDCLLCDECEAEVRKAIVIESEGDYLWLTGKTIWEKYNDR